MYNKFFVIFLIISSYFPCLSAALKETPAVVLDYATKATKDRIKTLKYDKRNCENLRANIRNGKPDNLKHALKILKKCDNIPAHTYSFPESSKTGKEIYLFSDILLKFSEMDNKNKLNYDYLLLKKVFKTLLKKAKKTLLPANFVALTQWRYGENAIVCPYKMLIEFHFEREQSTCSSHYTAFKLLLKHNVPSREPLEPQLQKAAEEDREKKLKSFDKWIKFYHKHESTWLP